MKSRRVLYLKCRGATQAVLEYFVEMLEDDVLDLVALSETWYTKAIDLQHIQPYILSSTINIQNRGVGRFQDGSLIMARPSDHSEYQCWASCD